MDIETIKKKIEALSAETVAGAVTPPTVATIFSNIADVLASTRSVLDVDVIRAEGNITLRFVVLNSESGAQETVEVILPQAEQTLAGLMSATDKANADTLKGWYDAVSGNAVLTTIYYDEATSGANTLCLKARSFNREGVSTAYSVMLPAATATTAGLMTAADRTKLDTTLPNQISDHGKAIAALEAVDTQYSGRIQAAEETIEKHEDRITDAEANISANTTNITSQGERITTLEEKTPTMWANLLAVKDTAVMVDGVRVELPAHKNVVIKDFQSFALADNTPNPKCITRFDIHYNGVAKIKSFKTSLSYTPTDETTKRTYPMLFTTIDVSMFDTSEFSSYNESIFAFNTSLISVDTSTWKMPNTRSINCLFEDCTNLVSVGDTGGWDLGNCNWFYATFLNCNNLEAVNTHGWNTAHVGNCQSMFANCKKLASLDFSTWDVSDCSTFVSLISGCPSLTDITFGEGFGKAKKEGLTLDLSSCGASKSYVLTDNTYNSMLTMYDRATNGLPTFTIKFNSKHNIPDGFIAAMTARGYTITQG